MGIRTALSTVFFGSLAAAVVVILVLTLSEQEDISQQTLSTRLESVAATLADDLFPILAQGGNDDVAILERLLRLSPYKGIEVAYVLNAEGKVIFRFRGPALEQASLEHPFIAAEPEPFDTSSVTIAGPRLVAKSLVGEQDEPSGYLVIIENISVALEQSQARLLQGMAIPVALTFLILVITTLLLINRFIAPIENLSQFTLVLSRSQRFGKKVQVEGSREVKELATNFNELLTRIEGQLAENETQNRQLMTQRDAMERLANYDALTNLPNRQFMVKTLIDELSHAKRGKLDFAVFFFDLDGFKNINDSLGHEVGDRLLVAVAAKVSALLREGDLFARLGGDEFLIRMYGCEDVTQVTRFAERLVQAFNKPLNIDTWQLNVKLSTGVARASDADYGLKSLMTIADMAMYESKRIGKGSFTIFSSSMMQASERKTKISALITHALESEEFFLVYQPRFGRDDRIKSFEVLCRWHSPVLGNVGPWEFIPIAEQTGSIGDITQWVLKQSMQDWHALAKVYGNDVSLSVNVSTQDLMAPTFADSVMQLLQTHDMPSTRLEFEITETSYLNDVELAKAFCQSVRCHGCRVALDDFGTGYSSLSYLTQIAVDVVKIDRSFVSNIGADTNATLVIKAILQLAKELKLTTCAEGVEEQSQYDFLRQHDCDEAQGYLLGKPSPLEHWLSLAELKARAPH